MKGALIVGAVLLAFAAGVYGLWRMVGGQVETAGARASQSVTVDVSLTLVGADGRPVAVAPVRLLLGPSPERQSPGAWHHFTTDEAGRVRATVPAQMDKLPKKRPANFVDGLFSRPEAADHLVIGVQLGDVTFRWLYAIELFRFREGGDVVSGGVRLFTRDEQGRFTREATQSGDRWEIAGPEGGRLSTPGKALTAFELAPKPESADAWALSLTFTFQADQL